MDYVHGLISLKAIPGVIEPFMAVVITPMLSWTYLGALLSLHAATALALFLWSLFEKAAR